MIIIKQQNKTTMSMTNFTEGQPNYKRLSIDRCVSVWKREDIEYNADKYTEEEFIKLFHASEKNGINLEPAFTTISYEEIDFTEETIAPNVILERTTLEILNEDGKKIYDNIGGTTPKEQ